MTSCSHQNFLGLPFSKYLCSEEAIEKDCFRDELLNALDIYGDNEPSIQRYVSDLWYKIAWDKLPEDDLEKFYQQSRENF